MPDHLPKLVKNSQRRKCQGCLQVHEYITRISDDAGCDTPVAFSLELATRTANLLAGGRKDVVSIPDDTLVVMDNSARKLPREGSGTARLAQFSVTERLA
jgi:hypothetical protein